MSWLDIRCNITWECHYCWFWLLRAGDQKLNVCVYECAVGINTFTKVNTIRLVMASITICICPRCTYVCEHYLKAHLFSSPH